MKIDIFTLCDSAKEYNGRLVIVGAINRIFVSKVPTSIQELTMVARIKCERDEELKKSLNILFSIKKVDEDVYIASPREMQANFKDDKNELDTINVLLKINNLIIPAIGDYVVSLKIDEQVFTTELKVVKGTK